jgi:COP9 signalosome complex subunit 5
VFYVSISSTAIEKIKEHAGKNPDKEVIGLLIGRMEGNTLIIEDTVTGEIVSEKTKAILTPETIAKIADEIVSGKIKGSIIGWYHSHPGFGVFMSEIDIKTQMKMQQFSPYIVALIIDPTKNEIGFFTVDANTRSPIMLTEDLIHIYAPREGPIPPKFMQPSPPQFFYPPPATTKPPLKHRKTPYIAVTLAAIVCLATLGAYLYLFRYAPVKADLDFYPYINRVFYGETIRLNANISGGRLPYNCTWYVDGRLKVSQKIVNGTSSSFNYTADKLGNVEITFNVTDNKTKWSKTISLTVIPNTFIEILQPEERSQQPWGEITIKGRLIGFKDGEWTGLNNKIITLSFKCDDIYYDQDHKAVTDNFGFFYYCWNTPNKQSEITIIAVFPGDNNFSKCESNRVIEITKRKTSLTLNASKPPKLYGQLLDEVTSRGVSKADIKINCTDGITHWLKEAITNKTGYFFVDLYELKPSNYSLMAEFVGSDDYYSSKCNIYIFPNFTIEKFVISKIDLNHRKIFFNLTLINNGFFDDNVNITIVEQLNAGAHIDSSYNFVVNKSELVSYESMWDVSNLTGKYTIQCTVNSNITKKKETVRITIDLE